MAKNEWDELVDGYQGNVESYRYDNEDRSSARFSSFGKVFGETQPTDYFVPSRLQGSRLDTDGGDFVGKSNYDVFMKEFEDVIGVVSLHGDYNSFGVAIRLDTLANNKSIRESLDALESYPVLSETDLSEKEHEAQEEAWDNHYKSDFAKLLRAALTNTLNEEDFGDNEIDTESIADAAVDQLTDSDLYDLYRAGSDKANVYWEGIDLDIERIVDNGLNNEVKEWNKLYDLAYKLAEEQLEEPPPPPVDPRQMPLPGVSERRRRR